MQPGTEFARLRKPFGAFVAVDDFILEVGAGDFVSLLGPSGCGKTTTLRMLAGLEFPNDGTISFGDRVVNDLRRPSATSPWSSSPTPFIRI